MNNILILGGSGFIGTNLVEYFLKQENWTVINLDIVPPRNPAHFQYWVKADLLDMPGLEKHILSFQPTYVLHMAARTDLNEKKLLSGYNANIEGVRNLVAVLKKCDRLQRAIFTSSMLVCSAGYSPASYDDYCPPNLYGRSKVLTEEIVRQAGINSYEWCIIRPTSIWGPWFGTPYRDFFEMVLRKKYLKIKGKVATKTFGFVGNSVHQISGLLYAPASKIHEQTFYIGDHPPININNWADEIADTANINIKKIPLALIKILAGVGDALAYFKIPFPMSSFRLNNMQTDNIISKLEDTYRVVGSVPYTRQEGIAITLDWIKKNDHKNMAPA